MDGVAMKLSIAVILAVLGYFIWTWWQGRSAVAPAAVAEPTGVEHYQAPPTDPIPQEPGVIMYGTNGCPWCVKQKEYFVEKKIEYTFKDCDKGECPNFVSGYPTIVKDGKAMPGYQEL
jgi:glutaredoxin